MLSLLLRNLFFTLLQPGMVAGLIPWLLLGRNCSGIFPVRMTAWNLSSFFLFIAGAGIMFSCIWRFAIVGRGTLSPADPTTTLVRSGLYRYSRNPMYVGVLLMLLGEALLFRSGRLGLYTLAIFVLFNLFVIYYEEPRLNRDFGEEYEKYCAKTPRWF